MAMITAKLIVRGHCYSAHGMTSVTSGIHRKHMACGPIMTGSVRAIFLPVSCFLYRFGEPKPTEKWSTYMKIGEEGFADFNKAFCS